MKNLTYLTEAEKIKALKRRKIQAISILGRRWFDRINGNTYHTSEISINGVEVHKTEFEYGYGEQYIWTAQTWLEKAGFIKPEHYPVSGGTQSLWTYCNQHDITYHAEYVDLPRRKDL